MALQVDIRLIGGKELQAALSELPIRLQKKIVRRALRNAAKRTRKAIQDWTPVLTGMLRRRGFLIRAVSQRRSGRIGVHILLASRKRLGIPASASHYYPVIIEYGSVKANIRPYAMIRRGFDATEASNLRLIRNEISEQIRVTWFELFIVTGGVAA